ncbi:MAG: DUF3341 domain-containing protein [Pirellulaceae bacterium]|nr:DUF3341 domain-containing protein [Pirellulaceae bacterium]
MSNESNELTNQTTTGVPELASLPAVPTSLFAIPDDQKPLALLADFGTVIEVMSAAEKLRDADFSVWDVHAPLPIHGINHSMGLRPTILPWITLGHGLVGCAFGLILVWWMNATSVSFVPTELQGYPFLVSGKPIFSLPANVPVIFETTILFAAIGTLLGLLGLNKQPMLFNPLNKSQLLRRATMDRFVVVVYAEDPKFQLEDCMAFLQKLAPDQIELVLEPR